MDWLLPHFQKNGMLSISEYMSLCLYDPEHGYYTTRNPLGINSDFLTAPETSQIFGELIALNLWELWQRMGAPEIHLIEMGPGQGTMMQDMMRVFPEEFKDKCCLHLVEVSPILKEEQKKRIEHSKIKWYPDLDSALLDSSGVTFVVANELFDALPIRQWARVADEWVERKVELLQNNVMIFSPESETIKEDCPLAQDIIHKISNHLNAYEGMALIIDYGYVGGQQGDTLQAMRRHSYVDILKDPGVSDLTAHVNFKALSDAARNVYVYGPTTQGHFLDELGINIRADILKRNATPAEYAQIEKATFRLTDPSQMGELFKVLALTGQHTPSPLGFSKCLQTNS